MIIEKLRRIAATEIGAPLPEELQSPNGWGPPLSKLLNEAADEIERLRAELDRANSPVWHDPKYGLVND